MKNEKQSVVAGRVSDACLDAYMADAYGTSWKACATVLLNEGLMEKEAEAVLRSKHMRWADDSEGRGNGMKCNSAAFSRYLKAWQKRVGIAAWKKEVFQIAVETFGTYWLTLGGK